MMLELPAIDVPSFLDARKVSALQVRVVVLCALVVLFDGLDTQAIGYLGPALSKDWNLSRAALGPIFSAGLVGLMLGLMILAPLADRMGRRWALLASTAMFGVFTLLTAGARGVTDLLIYRLLAGIGLGGALPNALALTGEYCPKPRRATLTVIMFCGFSLGSILGGGLTASLISTFGWRSIFLIGGAVPLFVLLPVLWMRLPESLQFLVAKKNFKQAGALLRTIDPTAQIADDASFSFPDPAASGVPVAQLFLGGRAWGTVLLWIVFFMNLLDFYFLQSWLPTVLTDSGLATETAVLVSTLISVGGIACGILSGPLMDRLGPYPVLAGLYLLGTIFVALAGATPSSLGAIVAVTFAAGFCVSGAQKSVNAAAVMFYPAAIRSTGVGWALGVGRLGSIAGPLVGGWLMGRGWSNAGVFQLMALPMLIAAVVIFSMGLQYGSRKREVATV